MTRQKSKWDWSYSGSHEAPLPFGVATLGVDFSLSSTGVALTTSSSWRVGNLSPPQRSVERLDQIYGFFRKLLTRIQCHHDLVYVAMEDYSFGSKSQGHSIGEGGGVTKLAMYQVVENEESTPLTLVPPTTLKKFVLGKGQGEKNQILLSVYKRWGVDLDRDDHADAYGLSRVAAALHSDCAEYKYEREVLEMLSTKRSNLWTRSPT